MGQTEQTTVSLRSVHATAAKGCGRVSGVLCDRSAGQYSLCLYDAIRQPCALGRERSHLVEDVIALAGIPA